MSDTGDTFASVLRSLRGELSQRELGRRASCSKSLIGGLELGQRRPTTQVAKSLDTALNAGGRLIALAHSCALNDVGSADDLFREWDDSVRRRDFLINTGAVGAITITGIGGAEQPGGGVELLEAHRALRAAHGRLDNLRGAGAVYTAAIEHHRQVQTWHASARTSTERQMAGVMAADTGGFAGFLSYDLGMTEPAVAHFRNAAVLAQNAGDLGLCANNIGQMSRVISDQGHRHDALHLMDRALSLADTRVHPAVRCWLHAVRAYHHARLDDAQASQRDLSAAWTLLEKTDDGSIPAYVGYISAAEVGKWTGHSLSYLSQPAFARSSRDALDASRSTWPATVVRGSAEVLAASARAYVALGDRDAAAHLLSQAVSVATATGSTRNLRAAFDVQAQLGAASA